MSSSGANKWRVLLGSLLAMAPFLCLCWLTFRSIYNFPLADDYDAILNFLNNFSSANTIREKFVLLITPHNEHLVIIPRIIALSQVVLTGGVNFKAMSLISLLALGLIFIILRKEVQLQGLFAIGLAFILFSPQPYEGMLWGFTSLQFFLTPLLALAACRLAVGTSIVQQVMAAFLGIAATFTQGGGFLVFFAIFLTAILNHKVELRWLLLGTIGFLLIKYLGTTSLSLSIYNFPFYFEFVLCLLGSAAGFESYYLSLIGGIFILGTYALSIGQNIPKQNSVLFSFFTFVILTAVGIAVSRLSFGVEFAYTQSRYQIYSLLALTLTYLILIILLSDFRIKVALGICSISFFLYSVIILSPDFQLRAEGTRDQIINWQLSGTNLLHPDQQRAAQVLNLAETRRNFKLKRVDFADRVAARALLDCPPTKVEGKNKLHLESVVVTPEFLIIGGYGFSKDKPPTNESHWITLFSSEDMYNYRLFNRVRPDVKRHFKLRSSQDLGFFGIIPVKEIAAGEYSLEYIRKDSHGCHRKTLKRKVKIS